MQIYSNVQNKSAKSHRDILGDLAKVQAIKEGEGQDILAGSMMRVTLPPAEMPGDNKDLAAATQIDLSLWCVR